MANALLYYLIVINVVTFLVYGIDKAGALLGMKVWHHKTMHKKFKYGLPLILIIQILLIITRISQQLYPH